MTATNNAVNFSKDSATVVKFINEIKASAGAYRHNVNQAIIGALYQAATFNNADALKQLQQVMMENAPRDLAVFNKLVSKFGCVVQAEDDTTVGKYKTKLVKGMMGDKKSIDARKAGLTKWLDTGIITVKNPAYVDDVQTKDVAKRIDVVFNDVFAYADFVNKAADAPKPFVDVTVIGNRAASLVKKLVGEKMSEDTRVRGVDVIRQVIAAVNVKNGVLEANRLNAEDVEALKAVLDDMLTTK